MTFQVIAHNAKIATFTLRDTGSGWFIEMNFAQAGVDAAMIHEYGEKKLNQIDRDLYKELFLNYIREHFSLMVDAEKIAFTDGGIKLGSHQTDVKFILPSIDHPQLIEVDLPMFHQAYNQTNIFRIYRGGAQLTKFFLSEDNDFYVRIEKIDGQFIQSGRVNSGFTSIVLGGVVFLTIGMMVFSLRKSKNSQLSEA